jgi:hypothetical protein
MLGSLTAGPNRSDPGPEHRRRPPVRRGHLHSPIHGPTHSDRSASQPLRRAGSRGETLAPKARRTRRCNLLRPLSRPNIRSRTFSSDRSAPSASHRSPPDSGHARRETARLQGLQRPSPTRSRPEDGSVREPGVQSSRLAAVPAWSERASDQPQTEMNRPGFAGGCSYWIPTPAGWESLAA